MNTSRLDTKVGRCYHDFLLLVAFLDKLVGHWWNQMLVQKKAAELFLGCLLSSTYPFATLILPRHPGEKHVQAQGVGKWAWQNGGGICPLVCLSDVLFWDDQRGLNDFGQQWVVFQTIISQWVTKSMAIIDAAASPLLFRSTEWQENWHPLFCGNYASVLIKDMVHLSFSITAIQRDSYFVSKNAYSLNRGSKWWVKSLGYSFFQISGAPRCLSSNVTIQFCT